MFDSKEILCKVVSVGFWFCCFVFSDLALFLFLQVVTAYKQAKKLKKRKRGNFFPICTAQKKTYEKEKKKNLNNTLLLVG